jgi:hypothetical protein
MHFWTALIRCCILDIERARHMIRGNTVLNNAEFNQNPGSVQKQQIILHPLACTVSQILLRLLATTIPQLLVRPLPSTDACFKSDGTLALEPLISKLTIDVFLSVQAFRRCSSRITFVTERTLRGSY